MSSVFVNTMNMVGSASKKMRLIDVVLAVADALSGVTETDMTIDSVINVGTVKTALTNAAMPYYEDTEFADLIYSTIQTNSYYSRSFSYYCKLDVYNAVIGLIGMEPFDDSTIDRIHSSISIDGEAIYYMVMAAQSLKKNKMATAMIAINNIAAHVPHTTQLVCAMKTIADSINMTDES